MSSREIHIKQRQKDTESCIYICSACVKRNYVRSRERERERERETKREQASVRACVLTVFSKTCRDGFALARSSVYYIM